MLVQVQWSFSAALAHVGPLAESFCWELRTLQTLPPLQCRDVLAVCQGKHMCDAVCQL